MMEVVSEVLSSGVWLCCKQNSEWLIQFDPQLHIKLFQWILRLHLNNCDSWMQVWGNLKVDTEHMVHLLPREGRRHYVQSDIPGVGCTVQIKNDNPVQKSRKFQENDSRAVQKEIKPPLVSSTTHTCEKFKKTQCRKYRTWNRMILLLAHFGQELHLHMVLWRILGFLKVCVMVFNACVCV